MRIPSLDGRRRDPRLAEVSGQRGAEHGGGHCALLGEDCDGLQATGSQLGGRALHFLSFSAVDGGAVPIIVDFLEGASRGSLGVV